LPRHENGSSRSPNAWHLDVATVITLGNLLFFSGSRRAIAPAHSAKPFEVHLMVTDPLAWIDPFVEAGADNHFLFRRGEESGRRAAGNSRRAQKAGVSLLITEPARRR